MNSEKRRDVAFRTRWGFVLASVGSAVGMANVWGFPHRMGANGGGAFLVAYIFFILLFSYVGLPTEFALGRAARTGTLGSYKHAWGTRGKSAGRVGGTLGWLPLAGSLCIAVGYAIIVAYVLKALVNSLTGNLMTVNPGEWFESFALTEHSVIPYHVFIVVITLLSILKGATTIEKTNKIIMPIFFIIFLILAVRVAFLPNILEGYKFMFLPDWGALLNPMTWVWAMGQAFFSLSITGSGMLVYGAYLNNKEDVVRLGRETALFDTIAAIIASLVIVPACFSYGLDVGAGPGLLFVTLPTILQDIPFGVFFAIILYTAMIFAGISSLQNMFEVVTESLLNRFPALNRITVLCIICAICLGFGLQMEAIFQWGPWMDLVSIYIIPLGACLGAVSWFWIMKKDALLEAINRGVEKPRGDLWRNIGRFVYVPATIILCAIALFMQVSF